MKVLGVKRSLDSFRWDLLYLLSQLSSDKRADVAALATSIEAAMNQLDVRRSSVEKAQGEAIMAAALVVKRDGLRDQLLVEMGGVARATGRDLYARLFPKYNPTQTAKLNLDDESTEIARILGELQTLDAAHPLRKKYELVLTDAQTELAQARAQAEQSNLAFTLQRSLVQQCKVDLDKLRVETHGKLVALLSDRQDADAFFRPTKAATEDFDSN